MHAVASRDERHADTTDAHGDDNDSNRSSSMASHSGSDETASPSSLPLRAPHAVLRTTAASPSPSLRCASSPVVTAAAATATYTSALHAEAARLCAVLQRARAAAAMRQQRAHAQATRERDAVARGAREQRVQLRRRMAATRRALDDAQSRLTAVSRQRVIEQERAATAARRVAREAARLDELLRCMLGMWRDAVATQCGGGAVDDDDDDNNSDAARLLRDGEALVRRLVMLHTHRRARHSAAAAAAVMDANDGDDDTTRAMAPRRRDAPVRVVAFVRGVAACARAPAKKNNDKSDGRKCESDAVRVDVARGGGVAVVVRDVALGGARRFAVRAAYDDSENAAVRALFVGQVAPLLRRACVRRGGGRDVCVLAHGAVASDKARLLFGADNDSGDDILSHTATWVMSRCVCDAASASRSLLCGDDDDDAFVITAVRLSVCEVRGDVVTDLLARADTAAQTTTTATTQERRGHVDVAALARVTVTDADDAVSRVRAALRQRHRRDGGNARHVVVRVELDVRGAVAGGDEDGDDDACGDDDNATALRRVLRPPPQRASSSSLRRWRVGVALVDLAPQDGGNDDDAGGGNDDDIDGCGGVALRAAAARRQALLRQQRRTRAALAALGDALVSLQRGVAAGDDVGACEAQRLRRAWAACGGDGRAAAVTVSHVAPVVSTLSSPSRSSLSSRRRRAAVAARCVRGAASWREGALTRVLRPLLLLPLTSGRTVVARVLLVACVASPRVDDNDGDGGDALARLRAAARRPRLLADARATLAYAGRVHDAGA